MLGGVWCLWVVVYGVIMCLRWCLGLLIVLRVLVVLFILGLGGFWFGFACAGDLQRVGALLPWVWVLLCMLLWFWFSLCCGSVILICCGLILLFVIWLVFVCILLAGVCCFCGLLATYLLFLLAWCSPFRLR